MMFKSNVLTAPAAAVLILVLLLQQSACHASAVHMDIEESLEEEKTGSGEAEDDNNVVSSGCHRVSKIVNFEEDLGWTFIVRPKSVDIGECVGYCSPLDPPSNTHQSLMRLLPNSREPCCVPSEYESLVLALSLNSQHSLHYIEDAVVKSCECL